MKKSYLISAVLFFGFTIKAHASLQPRGPGVESQGQTSSTTNISEKPKPTLPIVKQPSVVEVKDPNQAAAETPVSSNKEILVNLKDQSLKYFESSNLVREFKISSGVPGKATPKGEYEVLIKKPVVNYKGADYNFPHTKWNLMFKKGALGNFYIHGAYWHHNFGHPMSHGCINVSYGDMEGLYNWADVGTKIFIE